jgi:hypothetical protein
VISPNLVHELADRFNSALSDVEAALDAIVVQIDAANEATAVLTGLVTAMRREGVVRGGQVEDEDPSRR